MFAVVLVFPRYLWPVCIWLDEPLADPVGSLLHCMRFYFLGLNTLLVVQVDMDKCILSQGSSFKEIVLN